MKAFFSFFLICFILLYPFFEKKAFGEKILLPKKLQLAQTYFKEKKCSKVISTLNNSTSRLNSIWLKKMAYCFKKTKNLKQEQNIYLKLIEKNPKDYFSHFILASLYQKEASTKNTNLSYDIVKYFRKTIKIKNTFTPAYIKLFNIFKENKNYYELQALAENLLKIKNNNKNALTSLCFSYFKQDYIEETIKWCKQAIKHTNKTIADSFVYLALSLNKQKKSSGEKTLFYAKKKFPKSILIAETLANKYYKEKKYNISSKYYKQLLTLKSKNFIPLEKAAQSFFEIKNYQLNLQALKQLCHINKQEAVHIMRTTINKLERKKEKKWLSPYKLALAKDCY